MRFSKLGKIIGLCCLVSCLGLVSEARAIKEAKIWDGKYWQDMNPQAKITYIAGVCNMADYVVRESTALEKGTTDRISCILRCFVEELKTKTIQQVVGEVDKFYKENPAHLKKEIIEVILRRCTKICPAEPKPQGKKK